MTEIRAKRRTVLRVVEVDKYRCVVCGTWREAQQPAVTCSVPCRARLAYLRRKGERPEYAVGRIARR